MAVDDRLVRETLDGRKESFRILVERYQGLVYDLCWRMLGNAQDAEDAAQDAFVLFFNNLSRHRPGTGVINWLYTIALNVCRKALRRRKLARFFSLDRIPDGDGGERAYDPPSKAPSADQELEAREEAQMLQILVGRLPEALRAVALLHLYRGMGEQEIASVLGISPGNVRVRLHRARTALADGFRRAMEGNVTIAPAEDRQGRRTR